MKTLKPLFWFFLLTAFVWACQKEVSFETGNPGTPSDGSLQGAGGNCLGITVGGTYKKDTNLNSTHFVDVTVNVNVPGAYTIHTDTVNGMSFKATGTFAAPGTETVRLAGTGKPLAEGTHTFTAKYDSTSCTFTITTIPPAGGGGTSAFTVACGGAADSLTIGAAPTATDTVHINVNVTTAGTWTLTSTSAQGVTYSGSGTFAGTGAQTVTLTATGTPTGAAGIVNLTVTSGASNCSFPVTLQAAAPPPNGDIFPLTANSWWSYDDPAGFIALGDSAKIVNVGTQTFGGNVYRIFERRDEDTPWDTVYFRKDGAGNYHEWTWADYYTGVLAFDTEIMGDILFAKENMTQGQTWTSQEFNGQVGGVPVKIQYFDTCYAANVAETVNGKAFTGVYKVKWRPKFNAGAGYMDEFVGFETWFAKGIGMIRFDAIDLSNGTPVVQLLIRNWQVN